MTGEELINAIKAAGLTGRGGAQFDTAAKWQMVADAKSEKKYVICNASEGEPESHKDLHILQHHIDDVINGIMLAMHTVGALEGIIYMHEDKYKRFAPMLDKKLSHVPIRTALAGGGYRCGEETTLLNDLEHKRIEPRNKPPFPTNHGLFGLPTLVNNVETLWAVSKISKGEYKNTKFYTILGHVQHPGVYELDQNITIRELLAQTKNTPRGNTFAQTGGGASGAIIVDTDYDKPFTSLGAITIHQKKDIPRILKRWAKFYNCESCGLCVPCREGSYQIHEEFKKEDPDWTKVNDILDVLEMTSFCALGRSEAIPFKTLQKNNLVNKD